MAKQPRGRRKQQSTSGPAEGQSVSAHRAAGLAVPRESDPSLVQTSLREVWAAPSSCFSRHQVRPRTMASSCQKTFSGYTVIPNGGGPPLICWTATRIPGLALISGKEHRAPDHFLRGKARSLIPASPFSFRLSRKWLIVIKSWEVPYKIARVSLESQDFRKLSGK